MDIGGCDRRSRTPSSTPWRSIVRAVLLASVIHDGATRAARLVDDGNTAILLDATDVGALLQSSDWLNAAAASGPSVPRAEVTLAPVSRPMKTLCVGLNYRSHIEETGNPVPEHPTLFSKFRDTLCGPYADIVLPAVSPMVDWEAELTIVIGQEVRHVGPADAVEYIAGYTVADDVSMRDWQRRTTQWMQGKNFEAATPVGGIMATPDEVDNAADLRLTCTVDGELMQEARTDDLLFGPAALVSYISTFTTLRPGDLILTGTPAGVGAARTPPRFIGPGNVVVVALEGVAECCNRFIAPG
jgi:acylpyruvate hydrolase